MALPMLCSTHTQLRIVSLENATSTTILKKKIEIIVSDTVAAPVNNFSMGGATCRMGIDWITTLSVMWMTLLNVSRAKYLGAMKRKR